MECANTGARGNTYTLFHNATMMYHKNKSANYTVHMGQLQPCQHILIHNHNTETHTRQHGTLIHDGTHPQPHTHSSTSTHTLGSRSSRYGKHVDSQATRRQHRDHKVPHWHIAVTLTMMQACHHIAHIQCTDHIYRLDTHPFSKYPHYSRYMPRLHHKGWSGAPCSAVTQWADSLKHTELCQYLEQ